MSKAAMEVDFLGLEEGGSSTFAQEYSRSTQAPAATAEQQRRLLAPVPLRSPASRSAAGSSPGVSAPLTIFYNGTVTTFILPQDKAEAIIKWTESTSSGVGPVERPAADAFNCGGGGGGRWQQPPPFLLDKLGGDLPLARKRSLQRFLEKRKGR